MEKGKICAGKFPTVAVILLVVGIVWLLSDLGVITVSIPWWPVILIIIAISWINIDTEFVLDFFNFLCRTLIKKCIRNFYP